MKTKRQKQKNDDALCKRKPFWIFQTKKLHKHKKIRMFKQHNILHKFWLWENTIKT
jgi:hypothetical protein